MESLADSDKARLEKQKQIWGAEEGNLLVPNRFTDAEETQARRLITDWEDPTSPDKLHDTVMKAGEKELTKDQYLAAKAELIAEFGEVHEDEDEDKKRDIHQDNIYFIPLLIAAGAMWPAGPAGLVATNATMTAGGFAGGIAGAITAQKRNRKKEVEKVKGGKFVEVKCKKGKCKPPAIMEREPAGATVWNTGAEETTITSMTEMVKVPTAFVA